MKQVKKAPIKFILATLLLTMGCADGYQFESRLHRAIYIAEKCGDSYIEPCSTAKLVQIKHALGYIFNGNEDEDWIAWNKYMDEQGRRGGTIKR